MSMTVCDLSAITKPWGIEKRVADLVSSEFFEQGDMERKELNITPIDIMNREKEDQLPQMQVGFIDSICLPIYEVILLNYEIVKRSITNSTFIQAFADLSKDLKPLLEGVKENKKHWLELAQTAQETIKNRKNSIRSMSNGGMNNNNFNYSNGNNNNGDELSNASNESKVMSKIVGKFPLDANGIASNNSLFSTTYIKPQNGLITSYKTPTIVSFNSWKKSDGHEVMDQWELIRKRFFFWE